MIYCERDDCPVRDCKGGCESEPLDVYTGAEFRSDMLRRFSSRKFQAWFALFSVSTFALFAHALIHGLEDPVASFTAWATFNAAAQVIYSGTNLMDKGKIGIAAGEITVDTPSTENKPTG